MDKEIDLKVTQAELLSMMKNIHQILADNHINYSLTGGSLLGAIRESGFIPWDDDIDIMVDRKNYQLLRTAIESSQKYQMDRGPWLQHISPNSYESEIVPYIDVFILDNLPDSKAKSELKILLLRLLQGMLKEQVEYDGFSPVYKVCIFISHIFGKMFPRSFKLRLYDRTSQIGNKSESEFVSITNDSFGLLKKKHRSNLMEEITSHTFEDTRFMITSRYSEYLTTRYGADYMTPPAESERVAGQHANRPKVRNVRIGV